MTPDTTTTAVKDSPFRWEVVGLLWLAYFLNQADRQIFGVTLPLIKADFGLSSTQMGLIATTFTIVFGLAVPLAGMIGDMVRRERVVVFSLLVFSIGTLLTGSASGFLMLLLYRGIATGLGEAFYAPAANTLVAEHNVTRRGTALALHQTANYTGVVLGSLFAGWVADHYGWRAAFSLFGGLGLFWAIVIFFRSRRYSAKQSQRQSTFKQDMALLPEAMAKIAKTPALIAQVIGFSGLVFILVGYLTWTPSLLHERFNMPLAQAGFQSVLWHHVLAYVGLLITGAVGDTLVRRFPRARVVSMAISMIACAPFLWLTATAGTPFALYLALAGFGLFRGVYDANLFAAIYQFVEDRLRSTVTGLIVAVAYVIGALSPLMMGFLKDNYGLETGLKVLSGAALVAGLAFMMILFGGSRKTSA